MACALSKARLNGTVASPSESMLLPNEISPTESSVKRKNRSCMSTVAPVSAARSSRRTTALPLRLNTSAMLWRKLLTLNMCAACLLVVVTVVQCHDNGEAGWRTGTTTCATQPTRHAQLHHHPKQPDAPLHGPQVTVHSKDAVA